MFRDWCSFLFLWFICCK